VSNVCYLAVKVLIFGTVFSSLLFAQAQFWEWSKGYENVCMRVGCFLVVVSLFPVCISVVVNMFWVDE
jgi:hypothetical protein